LISHRDCIAKDELVQNLREMGADKERLYRTLNKRKMYEKGRRKCNDMSQTGERRARFM
jgi:hypothetical protein